MAAGLTFSIERGTASSGLTEIITMDDSPVKYGSISQPIIGKQTLSAGAAAIFRNTNGNKLTVSVSEQVADIGCEEGCVE